MTFFNVTFLPITIETDVITRHYVGKIPHKTGGFLLYMKNRKFCKMLKFTHPDEGSSTKMDLVYLLHIHSVRETSIRHMPMLLKGEYKWDYQTFY